MRKKLESELISIAHRILKLKGKEDIVKMHAEVEILHEKLSVLKFAHENFEDTIPTIGSDSSFFGMLDVAFNNKISDNIEVEDKIYTNLDDVEQDDIMEHGIHTIKDMVAFMPENTKEIDAIIDNTSSKKQFHKNDFEEITAGFEEIPVFEPVLKSNGVEEKKSLHDKLKNDGSQIDLNDKIAFIKHLFNGENEDYDRVISQINTITNIEDARRLIQDIVKPDYNDWVGKEEYEDRFMNIIENRFH